MAVSSLHHIFPLNKFLMQLSNTVHYTASYQVWINVVILELIHAQKLQSSRRAQ